MTALACHCDLLGVAALMPPIRYLDQDQSAFRLYGRSNVHLEGTGTALHRHGSYVLITKSL